MSSTPLPDGTSASTAPAEGGSETFDNRRILGTDDRTQRAVGWVGGVCGSLVFVVGLLLLTIFPLGQPDPTFGQRVVVPVSLVVLGGAFLAIAVLGRRFSSDVTEVVVDDTQVELKFVRGAVSRFRWDDPNLELSLSHVVRIPPRDPRVGTDWVFSRRGGGGFSSPVVTPEIGAALVAQARRNGLEVTRLRKEFRNRRGREAFEGTILAPPGKARVPGPDWNPVVVASDGAAPTPVTSTVPDRSKPPRVPHG